MTSQEMRNRCQNLLIGEHDKEKVWIKHLRNILETDIHENELGCKCDTHIKIGSVHLTSFYESRILFSHSYWIERFSSWLANEIKLNEKDKLFIVGYETDIETILFSLQQKMPYLDRMQYAIFEEKKYTQNNGYSQKDENIKYFDVNFDFIISNFDNLRIAFFCGTSSTLSTFKKMEDKLKVLLNKKISEELGKKSSQKVTEALDRCELLFDKSEYYSLIQVLPDDKSVQSVYNGDYCSDNTVRRTLENGKKYEAQFLTSVKCTWYDAGANCELCFPKNVFDEQPLIETSETSLVPLQMIKLRFTDSQLDLNDSSELNISRQLLSFLDDKYLFYGHISRMDQHFKYYIKTSHFIKDILDNKIPGGKSLFENRCSELKTALNTSKTLDIIVYPLNYGDEVFPLAINKYVFDGKAYMLSVNPNKEFRSNFETKFSNIKYLFKQQLVNEDSNDTPQIRFHYVTKQLNTTESFSRIKSFITSLMTDPNKKVDTSGAKEGISSDEKVFIFYSVITFLSRLSKKSKPVFSEENFYSFVDIDIPMLRNYGDSCPLCKRRQEVADYAKASSLDICANHWAEKYEYYTPKSLESVKNENRIRPKNGKDIRPNKNDIDLRHLTRFKVENELWRGIKKRDCFTETDYLHSFFSTMGLYCKRGRLDAESFVSFVKAISGPFLYYKEYEKQAALHLILQAVDKLTAQNDRIIEINVMGEKIEIEFDLVYKKYTSLIVLINALADMESTYILRIEKIINLCWYVFNLSKSETIEIQRSDDGSNSSLLSFGARTCLFLKEKSNLYGVEPFLSCFVYAFKRVICGISGEEKSRYFDDSIKNRERVIEDFCKKVFLDNSNVEEERTAFEKALKDLFYVLYLENNIDKMEIHKNETDDIIFKYGHDIREELVSLVPDSSNDVKLYFVYYDPLFKRKYPLCITPDKNAEEADKQIKSVEEYLFLKEYNVKYRKLFEDELLNHCGISFNGEESVFVVSLRHYALEDQQRYVEDNERPNDSGKNENKRKQAMYLVLEFTDQTNRDVVEKLNLLREILKYRFSLCNEINKDVVNNSIREAIQAKEAEHLMKVGKIVAHHADEDIRNALKLVDSHARRFFQENDNQLFSDICYQISMLTSRAIGHSANLFLLEEYYNSRSSRDSFIDNRVYDFEKKDSPQKDLIKESNSSNRDSVDTTLLRKYFESLLDGTSDNRVEYFLENYEMDNNTTIELGIRGNREDGSDIITGIIEEIRNVGVLPSFIEFSTSASFTRSIYLIGLIDLLIKNAVKHSAKGEKKIDIFFESDGLKEYSIEVVNKLEAGSTNSAWGVTTQFFEMLNQFVREDFVRYFSITTSDSTDDSSKFIARITVYNKRKE